MEFENIIRKVDGSIGAINFNRAKIPNAYTEGTADELIRLANFQGR